MCRVADELQNRPDADGVRGRKRQVPLAASPHPPCSGLIVYLSSFAIAAKFVNILCCRRGGRPRQEPVGGFGWGEIIAGKSKRPGESPRRSGELTVMRRSAGVRTFCRRSSPCCFGIRSSGIFCRSSRTFCRRHPSASWRKLCPWHPGNTCRPCSTHRLFRNSLHFSHSIAP